ncbi:hypothetical protein F4818DRAFT_442622 [Hypoxylon cercidicola]|nr:hypothetical protein F4818DRAFT_442622 [Hypoxylon cercidicola]
MSKTISSIYCKDAACTTEYPNVDVFKELLSSQGSRSDGWVGLESAISDVIKCPGEGTYGGKLQQSPGSTSTQSLGPIVMAFAILGDASAELRLMLHVPLAVDTKQIGREFWATSSRYLKRSFLLVLADELGHDIQDSPIALGDENDSDNGNGPDDTGIIGIAKLLQHQRGDEEEENTSDDEAE